MSSYGNRMTGNEPSEGADPGGTHSTKPGNPDKKGPPRPSKVGEGEHVISGDRNDGTVPPRPPRDNPAT